MGNGIARVIISLAMRNNRRIRIPHSPQNANDLMKNLVSPGCRESPFALAFVAQLAALQILTLRVKGSSPFEGTIWDVGQTVKMSACHAVRSGFNSRTSRQYVVREEIHRLMIGSIPILLCESSGEF